MRKIAYLSSKATLPGSPLRRSDAYEHDRMMTALSGPFEALGMSLHDVDWADPEQAWSDYDAVMIGTTWDYWDHPREFLQTLAKIETETQLFNSAGLVAWNSHKTYLKELETKGARLIPTLWIDKVTPEKAEAAFVEIGSDDLVFKRQVGAGADGQYRLKHHDPLPPMDNPMMVQPFLSMIQTEGEISFIFIDGVFCHALIKRAKAGDYRIQSNYGGVEEPIQPRARDLEAAKSVIDTLGDIPLYGRVDMLRGEDGGLLLMELELIEPYLYPLEGPNLGPMLAAAVRKRLQ